MKKVLFATTNPAKVVRFKEALLEHDIEMISISDLDEKDRIEVDETGKNELENAYLKAEAYYDKLKMPVIAMDCGLYMEGVPDEIQPGTHVRRINGKNLSDEELIEYYVDIVKKYGKAYNGEKRIYTFWRYGLVVIDDGQKYDYGWDYRKFYFVEKRNSTYEKGYALDAITKLISTDEYYTLKKHTSDNPRGEVEFVISKLGKSV